MAKTHIVVHHSLTADSGTVSWDAIRRYHTQTLHWRDIGYHFGIELIGDRYEILLGRLPDMEGAHTSELNMNTRAVGICCVGNYDLITPPTPLITQLVELIRWLRREWPEIRISNVLGHREIGLMAGFNWEAGEYKTCPGKLFDMNDLRGMI